MRAEDEPSGSKHVEDIKNYNISLTKVHFVGLYYTTILQSTVQKTKKAPNVVHYHAA